MNLALCMGKQSCAEGFFFLLTDTPQELVETAYIRTKPVL